MSNAAPLPQDDILKLYAAVIAAGLTKSRSTLLSGIDATFAAGLSDEGAPGTQILSDLNALNGAGELADGTVPLVLWLRNAVALAGPRREAEVFRRALEHLGDAGQAPKPQRAAPVKQAAGSGAASQFGVTISNSVVRSGTDGVYPEFGHLRLDEMAEAIRTENLRPSQVTLSSAQQTEYDRSVVRLGLIADNAGPRELFDALPNFLKSKIRGAHVEFVDWSRPGELEDVTYLCHGVERNFVSHIVRESARDPASPVLTLVPGIIPEGAVARAVDFVPASRARREDREKWLRDVTFLGEIYPGSGFLPPVALIISSESSASSQRTTAMFLFGNTTEGPWTEDDALALRGLRPHIQSAVKRVRDGSGLPLFERIAKARAVKARSPYVLCSDTGALIEATYSGMKYCVDHGISLMPSGGVYRARQEITTTDGRSIVVDRIRVEGRIVGYPSDLELTTFREGPSRQQG